MEKIDLELRKRFIKDYSYPIQVLYDPWFTYFLDLYEPDYGCKTKWEELCEEIEVKYGGSNGKYLESYYEDRNKIILEIEGSESYQKFVGDQCFGDKYKNPGEKKTQLYTQANIGKEFTSIDLRKANFQALRFYDPDILKGAKTYGEFISLYSSSKFLQESKYTRQVIFGKLNPKRQITIEKYLVWKIQELIDARLGISGQLFSRHTDELIYTGSLDSSAIEKLVQEELGLEVKAEVFKLGMLQMFTSEGISVVGYTKNYSWPENKNATLHSIPVTHFAQMYKYWKGLSVNENDLVFMHEGMVSIFLNRLVAEPRES